MARSDHSASSDRMLQTEQPFGRQTARAGEDVVARDECVLAGLSVIS